MSHWYAHTLGTRDNSWYWISHPDLPGTYTRGESNEEDADWETVCWWSGPFSNYEIARDNMIEALGNAGSYQGPHKENSFNQLPEKLTAQMTPAKRARSYW